MSNQATHAVFCTLSATGPRSLEYDQPVYTSFGGTSTSQTTVINTPYGPQAHTTYSTTPRVTAQTGTRHVSHTATGQVVTIRVFDLEKQEGRYVEVLSGKATVARIGFVSEEWGPLLADALVAAAQRGQSHFDGWFKSIEAAKLALSR